VPGGRPWSTRIEGVRTAWSGSDAPAGQCRTDTACLMTRNQETGRFVRRSRQSQSTLTRCRQQGDMAEDGRKRLRFDAFFQGPGQLLWAPGPNHEKSTGIKSERLQSRTVGQTKLMPCRIRRSPEKEVFSGTAQASHPPGDQRLRKAESGPAILIGLGPHFMQTAWGQAVPGQSPIDFGKTECPVVFVCVGRSSGRSRLNCLFPGRTFGPPRLNCLFPDRTFGPPRLLRLSERNHIGGDAGRAVAARVGVHGGSCE